MILSNSISISIIILIYIEIFLRPLMTLINPRRKKEVYFKFLYIIFQVKNEKETNKPEKLIGLTG